MSNTIYDLFNLGYFPIPCANKRPALRNWPEHRYTDDTIQRAKRARPEQVGVLTGEVVGVDLDTRAEDLALVTELMVQHLGPSEWRRVGNPERALYVYRTEATLYKCTSGQYAGSRVEILAKGQQFIVAGRYDDDRDYQCPELPPVAELPVIGPEQVEAFIAAVNAALEAKHGPSESAGLTLGDGMEIVRDLTPDMVVVTQDGAIEVGELHGGLEGVRCCMDFIREGADADNSGTVHLDPEVMVNDYVTGLSHRLPEAQPDALLSLLKAKEREKPGGEVLPLTALPELRMVGEGAKRRPSLRQPATPVNVRAVLDHARMRGRVNMMTHKVEYWVGSEVWGLKRFEAWLAGASELLGMSDGKMRTQFVYTEERYHPVEEWLPEWDGVSRFADLCNSLPVHSADIETRAIYLRRFLIQAVQGALGWENPASLEHVLVLVGPGGIGKTYWLQHLAPRSMVLTGLELHLVGNSASKDSVTKATRHWINELGELDSTFRKSDISAIKSFLSTTNDFYRGVYERGEESTVRTSVYTGSVNHAEFLVDATGNRRYWPLQLRDVRCGEAPDMAQMWAEAATWWEAGEPWLLTDEEEAIALARLEAFEQSSTLGDRLDDLFGDGGGEEVVVNVTRLLEMLDREHATPVERSFITAWMTKRFGPSQTPRLGDGRRMKNAWRVERRKNAPSVAATQNNLLPFSRGKGPRSKD